MSEARVARPGAIGSLGELLVEFVCTVKDSHHLNASSYVGPFPSGAPGIFIDQAARVGARAIFSGAVGDDAFGQVLRQRLALSGVSDVLITSVPGVPTGSAFVAYNGDGSREFVFNIAHSAAGRFPAGPEAVDALRNFRLDAFHISGSTLGDAAMAATALAICRALKATGVAISFDPNIRKELLTDPSYMQTVRALLEISAFVLPSEEDAAILFPNEPFEVFARRFIAGGARYVVLKRGEHGCVGIDAAGQIAAFDAHNVEVADPTGAGDCFCATFVSLIASGDFAFGEALRRANAAGALAVGRLGPMEGNSTLAEIEAFLATCAPESRV